MKISAEKRIVEEQQKENSLSEENSNNVDNIELIEEYVKKFVKENLSQAIYFCKKWDGTNGIYFRAKETEDFVFEILDLILEGRRKVYTDFYENFKGSVFYHLNKSMLTFFRCNKNENEIENKSKEISLEGTKINDEDNYSLMYKTGNYKDVQNEIFDNLENEELREKIFSLFDENDEKESEEILVLEEILKGLTREEIAKVLGLRVEQVTNIYKRIKRKILKNKNKIL